MEHTIDAQGKKLGRVASEAARFLIGKNSPAFARNVVPKIKVLIVNTAKADISNKKLGEKAYVSYSGYPGGLKTRSMKKIVTDKGVEETFRKAVYGMLPKNKLRAIMIKNLVVQK